MRIEAGRQRESLAGGFLERCKALLVRELPICHCLIMKRILSCLVVFSLCGTPVVLADHHKKEEGELGLPTSWKKFLSFKRKQKSFGVWSNEGKTTDIWEGIPAGLDYSNTFTSQLSADGTKILTSHIMQTADGTVLSTGSGMETWDPKRKKIVSSSAGFDGGKFYSGSAELIGVDEGEDRWKYTESISGKTYEVMVTWKSDGPDRRSQALSRAGKPEKVTVNKFTRKPRVKKSKP